MSDRSQRYRDSGRGDGNDGDGCAQVGTGTGTPGRDTAPSSSREPVRERRSPAEEVSPLSASTAPRQRSQSRGEGKGRTGKRKHGFLVPVIAVCVTCLVLVVSARVLHPDGAAASASPSVAGSASSGSANKAGALSGASSTASPTPTPMPSVLTQTVQSAYTTPGDLDLAWPTAIESAMALEGVGTLGTHGSPDKPVPIASVTKTMTAYLVLKDHPISPGQSGATLTVESGEAAAYRKEQALDQSLVPVNSGEELTERQALQALMLASADNVAQILGRWDAGSDSAFVTEMNDAAGSLGMGNTRFTDPSGYDADTRSTANDLIKLGEAAMAIPAFAQIVDESSAYIPVAGTITNYNKLLGVNGVDGIKTGSTTAAGGCLLFAAKHVVGGQTVTVIGVVLGAPGVTGSEELSNVLSGSDELLESAEKQLGEFTVAKQGVQVATGPSPGGGAGGGGTAVPLGPQQSMSLVAWPGLALTLKISTVSGAPVLTVTGPSGATLGTTQLAVI